MKGRLIHIALLITLGLIFSEAFNYFHLRKSMVNLCLLVFIIIALGPIIFNGFKRNILNEKTMSAWFKMMIASAIGVIAGLMLIVLHKRNIGYPIVNCSLLLNIIGWVGFMSAPLATNNIISTPLAKRKTILIRSMIALPFVGMMTALLLITNHYRGARPMIFWSFAILIISLLVVIIYGTYLKKKRIV